MNFAERVRVPDSPYFAEFRELLGLNKMVLITCKGRTIRIIDGSIGNGNKNNGCVNVEIDFGDGAEKYKVYPFGVNRIISDQQILGGLATTRLGIAVSGLSHLSWDQPKPNMDHSTIAGLVWEFVNRSLRSGKIKEFKEAADFRRTLKGVKA